VTPFGDHKARADDLGKHAKILAQHGNGESGTEDQQIAMTVRSGRRRASKHGYAVARDSGRDDIGRRSH
jgi:hypothetical protein